MVPSMNSLRLCTPPKTMKTNMDGQYLKKTNISNMDVQNDAIFEAGDLFKPIILGIYVRFKGGTLFFPGFLEVPSQFSILDGPAKYPPP